MRPASIFQPRLNRERRWFDAPRSTPITLSDDYGVEDSADDEREPLAMADFLGQQNIKDSLMPLVELAKRSGKPMDHLLLEAPTGFGKATLAEAIGTELGSNVAWLSGREDEYPADWIPKLVGLKKGDVLVVDEIHLIREDIENILYRATSQFVVTWEVGQGRGTKEAELALERFTLIGLTSRLPALSTRMRDRFGSIYRFLPYDLRAMSLFVVRFARELEVPMTAEGAVELARRSRGIPQVAERLLYLIRDYSEARREGILTGDIVLSACSFLKVDRLGLDENDRRFLATLVSDFGGGPVGLSGLADALGEYPDAVADTYEPFLMRLRFLVRTPEGRVATPAAYEYLGLPRPSGAVTD
jgi:Holliday junction DNA helicase RuvB